MGLHYRRNFGLSARSPTRLRGHEIMFAVAPDTASETPTLELERAFHPNVPIRGHLGEHRNFFDSSKATRILGWRHEPRPSFDASERSFA